MNIQLLNKIAAVGLDQLDNIILVDPQDYERNNPCGFVMMLNFFDDDKRIEIEYFSVSKGLYFKDKNQRTVLLGQDD